MIFWRKLENGCVYSGEIKFSEEKIKEQTEYVYEMNKDSKKRVLTKDIGILNKYFFLCL